jgi:hypothetical protein
MTYTEGLPPSEAPTLASSIAWESCDHCQAPLGERQRYCVVCGARRPHVEDPVARWFATTARQARASEAPPPAAAPRPAGIRSALALALLPVAAAAGVMVGRGQASDGQQLVDALRAQKAPVVNVVGGGGAAGDASAGGGDTTRVRGDDPNDADGKVIARTPYGTARQLTGAKVTKEQLDESKQALDRIVNSKGKAYVESQRNLPDQIVIP